MTKTNTYHEPVLLQESVDGLNIHPAGIYVDVTYGGGGHTKEITRRLNSGKVFSFDRDVDAVENEIESPKIQMVHHDYRYMKNFLRYYNAIPVDGILADLGVSSHQFDSIERGFSIRGEADLDMRMDKDMELTAKKIVNQYSEIQLSDVFYHYGELYNASKIARTIIGYREQKNIETTDELKKVTAVHTQKGKENQFYAQLFQALRIEVNDELGSLKEMLLQCKDVIKTGGRLVVISYHSLEDRLVKNYMSKGQFEGEPQKDLYGNYTVPFKAVNKKVIVPSEDEIKKNNRARSAKLRIAERII
jgi:16S rRNA (cytosine1402-N4)-methyltransferase